MNSVPLLSLVLPGLAGPGGALERQNNLPKQEKKRPKASNHLAEYRTKPAGRESREIHGVWEKRKITYSVTGGFAQTC